ncbi:very short patch repair endonuclease [Phenylobacterium sp.]|uniref:very short patch repair endonuclease n=1 Tax=Phenylobacterium sp. TaxID=1871053 RepID=UPI00273041B6|nr:DNA mismatch endonuclease Vsr [Phenylobacterium sp.]MDP2214037.1 DNA mismatch endonuclease Vsr [Phenylobacterium sp.]
MGDVYDAAKRSAVMRQVKGTGTGPERTLRRLLTGLGARYRLNRRDLPGSPDIVLPGRRLAIFAHGCFWHGHDCARGARVPKANRDYWLAKVGRNRARDAAVGARLAETGWRVEVVWECEMRNEAALEARLAALLDRAPLSSSPGRRVSAVKRGHKGHEGGAKDTK